MALAATAEKNDIFSLWPLARVLGNKKTSLYYGDLRAGNKNNN